MSWSGGCALPAPAYKYVLDAANGHCREGDLFTGVIKATVPSPAETGLTPV
ncbi:hypothetical protein [Streptomyces sp.]|uniref:hypothetical protein n=1 Tax=Streptomyces sp. TaxID=1931 RepID=UPI002F3F3462